MHRTRQHYYFHGAKPSHLLVMSIRSDEVFADIPSIWTAQGVLTTESKTVNDTFRSFYSGLYSSEVMFNQSNLDSFLSGLELPKLVESDAELLATPITIEELKLAAKEMRRGRAPGWDGIPPEVYLRFSTSGHDSIFAC